MALETNELFASRDFLGRPRMVVERNKVGTIGPLAVADVLPVGTPLAWDDSANQWAPYTQPSDTAEFTITSDATPATAGTMTLYIDGVGVTASYAATAANLQTSIRAALVDKSWGQGVVCAATAEANLGVANAVITITFPEAAGAPFVQLDVADLTGNVHVLATSDAGTALNGTNVIAGFLAHQKATVGTSDDVQITIMLAGEVHRDDINTTAIRSALLGSPSEAELDTALKAVSLREKGITVRGLAAVEG